jgi:3-hydroxyacyl-[acyl-carrier-protein] dehydratase
MRWYWFDQFTEFESGRRAVAVKRVNFAGEETRDYVPGFPVYPSSLIVEGMAQIGGVLVGWVNEFRENIVLAKVSKATFHDYARPGDELTLTVDVQDIRPEGAFVSGTCHVGTKLVAEVELCFAYIGEQVFAGETIDAADWVRIVRNTGVFAVGKDSQGNRLNLQGRLLEAASHPTYPGDGCCRF